MQIDHRVVPLALGMTMTLEIKTSSRRLIEYVTPALLRRRHENLRER
jgi:hypothetical protein